MTPSDRRILISLIVSFAVAVPILRRSAATGVEGSAKAAAAAAAPSPHHGEVLQPEGFNIPDLPLPRILPCPPWFPKIPLIPCFNVTPPPPPPTDPRECRSSLRSLILCAGFLTNASVLTPPSTCCDGFDPFFANQSSPALLCLCHIASADIAQLLPAPMNHTRAASIMEVCGLGLPIDALSRFCKNNRDQVPPIDRPSPPSVAAGTKA